MNRALRHTFIAILTAGTAVLTGLPRTGHAALDSGLRIARLKYGGGGDWYGNQTTLPNLMKGLSQRTSIAVGDMQEARIEILSEELFDYPMVCMSGHGTVRFSDDEARRLRAYLDAGGFLWADDDYGMDKSFREEMKRVFPDRPMVELPFSHEIYHCFYDFPAGLPKIHEHDGKPPQGFGIFDRGRLVVFYTYETDISDGLEDPEIHNDPPQKREEALRFAINLVDYVMTH